jgi:hypothetical protein
MSGGGFPLPILSLLPPCIELFLQFFNAYLGKADEHSVKSASRAYGPTPPIPDCQVIVR